MSRPAKLVRLASLSTSACNTAFTSLSDGPLEQAVSSTRETPRRTPWLNFIVIFLVLGYRQIASVPVYKCFKGFQYDAIGGQPQAAAHLGLVSGPHPVRQAPLWGVRGLSRLAGRNPSAAACGCTVGGGGHLRYHGAEQPRPARSEERRVGKECRCRWSAYH